MGAVSSAFVYILFSTHFVYPITNENPKTFENYGGLRKLFTTRV